MKTDRAFRVAAWLGAIGVALGAFGAHGLQKRVEVPMLEIWKTGVFYHLIHAVVLLALALAARGRGSDRVSCAWWAIFAGIFVFSGTLYTLVLTGQKWLGAITPIGGTAMIVGWLMLALRKKEL